MHQTTRLLQFRYLFTFRKTKKYATCQAIFKSLFSIEIVSIIVRETNRKALGSFRLWNEAHPNKKPQVWTMTTEDEMYAFFGLLLLAAGIFTLIPSHRKNYGRTKTNLRLWTMYLSFWWPTYRWHIPRAAKWPSMSSSLVLAGELG